MDDIGVCTVAKMRIRFVFMLMSLIVDVSPHAGGVAGHGHVVRGLGTCLRPGLSTCDHFAQSGGNWDVGDGANLSQLSWSLGVDQILSCFQCFFIFLNL